MRTELVLSHARVLGGAIVDELVRHGARAELAGGVRRAEEVVDALAIVVDRAPSEVEQVFRDHGNELSFRRTERGILHADLELEHGTVPVRVRCTSARGFVEGLFLETGHDAHLYALEERARKSGRTLSDVCGNARDERDVYESLTTPFIPPELRDDASLTDPGPLVEAVYGTFHVHTNWSDGLGTVLDMARAAEKLGLRYLGISDHSQAASYANGLDATRLVAQRALIDKVRKDVPGIRLLHGIECDVLSDGTLDLPDAVLADLDFVIASVHSDLKLDRRAQTKRIVRALGHPLVTILGHPTGRLLGGRPGITFDMDAVARAAAASGVHLEINTTATRLDLDVEDLRIAASHGATFCIDPDAHEPQGLDTLGDGVLLARRARLAPHRVFNTLDVDDMVAALRSRREVGARALGLS